MQVMNISTGNLLIDIIIFLIGVLMGYMARVYIEKREKRKAGL